MLGALLLLAILVIASTRLSDSARLEVTASVNAHWRGAYDLLVVPRGGAPDLTTTGGLVEPNFISYGTQGAISLDQLASIRALPGVGLAAPIGVVGYVSSQLVSPQYVMTRMPDAPTLYHLTLTLTSSDGLRQIVLQRQQADLLVGPADGDASNWVDTNQTGGGGGNDPIESSFQPIPEIRTEIVAVDPKAEQALLGSQATALAAFDAPFDRGTLTPQFIDCSLSKAAFAILGEPGCSSGGPTSGAPIVPVLVSQDLYTPLSLKLEAIQVGRPLAAMPNVAGVAPTDVIAAARRLTGSDSRVIGVTERDISNDIRPFSSSGDLSLLFPGDPPAHGIVKADGDPVEAQQLPPGVPPGYLSAGLEAGYRKLTTVSLSPAHAGPAGPAGELEIDAIGSGFDLARMLPATDPLTYVPFGAYDPPVTHLVAGPDGLTLGTPVTIHPTLDPAGFIDTPPLAITDLLGATLLRGTTPIDAIRVRVAGITDFDAPSQATVEHVADRIRSLGLDVVVVAGSSPQTVELYVPDYVVDGGRTTDLGYVRQAWTTLGAAQRVATGLGEADLWLLASALAIALILAAGMELSRTATRTREVAVLRATGWTPGEIFFWLSGDGIVAGLIMGAIAIVAWGSGERSSVALGAGLLFAAVLPLSSTLSARVAARAIAPAARDRGDTWLHVPHRGLMAVRGPTSLGVRAALARPARSGAAMAALGVAAAAISLGTLVVDGCRPRRTHSASGRGDRSGGPSTGRPARRDRDRRVGRHLVAAPGRSRRETR